MAALVLLASCSKSEAGEGEAAPAGPAADRDRPEIRTEIRSERSTDPRVVELRGLLEDGWLDRALPLLDLVGPTLPIEGPLLRARALALEGRAVDWGRVIEDIRERAPEDARVYATAAELHAAAGRTETSRFEINQGLKACGPAPELDRARGVLAICVPGAGQAGRGLVHLERAIARDPELPFVTRALGQACLLAAKEAMSNEDFTAALIHGRRALEFDREDVETRRFLADVLAAGGQFELAIEILVELVDEGQPLEGEIALLHKRAGLLAILRSARDEALEHFLAARERGLSIADLGTGAHMLFDEADRRIEAGVEAFRAGDLETAERELAYAVRLDPESLEGHNHLGVVRFERRDFRGAAESWRGVIDAARAESIELPEPLHVHLSRALFRLGDVPGARAALEEYLRLNPEGRFVAQTREQLSLLDE